LKTAPRNGVQAEILPGTVTLTGKRLVGLEPETGAILWSENWPTNFEVNAATPLVWTTAPVAGSDPQAKGGDAEALYAFVTSGYGQGCCLINITREKAGTWTLSQVYRTTRLRSHFGSPVRVGDWICGFDEQLATALDWRTGETLWKKRGYKKGTLLGAGGNLLILGEEGELLLARPDGKDLNEIWRQTPFGAAGPRDKKAWTAPVAASGMILLRDEENLICLGAAKPAE
jgi:outer membrane protein assembly factor BamB